MKESALITLTVVGNGLKRLEEAAEILGSFRKARKAYSRAINHTGRIAGTEAGRALAEQTGLPKSTGRRAVRRNVEKSTPTTLTYTIHGSGGNISLKHFKPRETRKGVSAAPFGQRIVFGSTFMKAGWWPNRIEKPAWNRQVFLRTGEKFSHAASNPRVLSGEVKRVRTGSKFAKQKSGVFIPVEMVRGQTAAAFQRAAVRLEPRVAHEIRAMTKGVVS